MTVIAVDGPAGVGKSTVARAVAEKLDYGFLSSGMVYRAIAWVLAEAGWDGAAGPDLKPLASLALRVDADGSLQKDGLPLTADLRNEQVSALASRVSAEPAVRDMANQILRDVVDQWVGPGGRSGAVLEGRDIGTVVYPDATHKLFLTASAEVRAERRWLELREQDPDVTKKEILAAVQERDRRDETRAVAPLKPAEDAIVIDTSALTLEQVIETVLRKLGR